MKDESNKAGHIFAEVEDPKLREALQDFRANVHAWSDAAYSARRTESVRPAAVWRRTVAWALSLTLSIGAVSGALYDRHHQRVLAEQQHQRELQMEQQQKQLAAEQHERDSEDLLANVDSDIAREVPAAMEPLAEMMTDDGGTQ